MPQKIRYGKTQILSLNVPAESLVAECSNSRNTPLDDPAAAVAAALMSPLSYPPLKQAVVPGDQVVIALDAGTPQVASVVAGIVHTLCDASVEAGDITILAPEVPAGGGLAELRKKVLAGLDHGVARDVQVAIHDPVGEGKLAYLAATSDGHPIYLNRLLCDADVVLPVETARVDSSLGYLGVHACLYPGFSDRETQARFRVPAATTVRNQQQRHREEANEVAWLLGIQFALQIIPGPGDSVLHVLAGQVDEIASQSQRLCRKAWTFSVPRWANLVIASIEGGDDQQTWENFGRALFAASQVCAESGTIVLCTELRCQPGPALQCLVGHGRSVDILNRLNHECSADAVSASLLMEACESKHIYLLSGLSEQTVEDLGLGFVSEPDDIARLSQRHPSCILLADAHRAMPTVAQASEPA
jgi:nickel-dependent lactate racemase